MIIFTRSCFLFSASFTQLCPNGVGFVMNRHGVTGRKWYTCDVMFVSDRKSFRLDKKNSESSRILRELFSKSETSYVGRVDHIAYT